MGALMRGGGAKGKGATGFRTYETAWDWISSLFASRSGARKDFEVKDATEPAH